jgi:type II secretory pathway component GspD/PulD (secretin)
MAGIYGFEPLKPPVRVRCLRRTMQSWGFTAAMICPAALPLNACMAQSSQVDGREADEELEQGHAGSHGRVSVVQVGATLERILGKLREQGMNIRARGAAIETRVDTFIVRQASPTAAAEALLNAAPNLVMHHPANDPTLTEIWTKSEYKTEVLPTLVVQKTYKVKYASPQDTVRQIDILLTPNLARAAVDRRTGKIFVSDLPEVHAKIESMIHELDVDFITRVFYVKYADVDKLAADLKRISKGDPDYPIADLRTRQIVVRDRLDVIRHMELLVQTLDIPTTKNEKDDKAAGAGPQTNNSKSRTGETDSRPADAVDQTPAPDASRSEKHVEDLRNIPDVTPSSAVSQPGGHNAVRPAEDATQTLAAL